MAAAGVPRSLGVAAAELAARGRGPIAVASLVTGGRTEELAYHLGPAKENGLTETELIEVIATLASTPTGPKAVSAMTVARRLFSHND